MTDSFHGFSAIIAQAVPPAGPGRPNPQGEISPAYIWGGMLLFFAVFYVMMFRSRSKQQQRFQQLLSSLKRNDRVVTIGGIFGTVVDVRDKDVTLKIDETSNVKVRVEKAAIKEVIREPAETK